MSSAKSRAGTFDSKSLTRPRPRNSKNQWIEPETRHSPFVPALSAISQIAFPETGWTRENARDQRPCQPARPYLLIIKAHIPESKLPILYSRPIFKKWQKTGIPTHSLHGSHTYTRAQTYTREDIPGRLRHPSVTHIIHTLIYVPFS